MSCEACFRQHKHAWDAAVQHPFLKSCQQGSINQCQFDTWLVQDYLFVKEFTRLAANLLTVAPYCDYEGLLGGLGALRDELKWFQVSVVCFYITVPGFRSESFASTPLYHLTHLLASSGTSC